jgi:signal transduction histidine kinase
MRVQAGIETTVDMRLPENVPQAIQGIVLKNIGEVLTNVEKHAQATRVTVVAEESGGGIRVEVADDGTGFVVAESVRVPGHIGLVALRERAQLAGGWCRIESEPGAGTKVDLWVPLSL